MNRPPEPSEYAEYHLTYISKVECSGDILTYLDSQSAVFLDLLHSVGESQSLQRYAEGKWSFREALSHINDTERVFAFRAFWFARGGEDTPLPGFDQDRFAANAAADARPWLSHVDEFISIRAATMSLLRSLPPDAWDRIGTASGKNVSTRALAWMIAGHLEHHRRIFVEKYLAA